MMLASVPVWMLLVLIGLVLLLLLRGVAGLLMQKRAVAGVLVLFAGLLVIAAFLRTRPSTVPAVRSFERQVERLAERTEELVARNVDRARSRLGVARARRAEGRAQGSTRETIDALAKARAEHPEPVILPAPIAPMIVEVPGDVAIQVHTQDAGHSIQGRVVTAARASTPRSALWGSVLTAVAIATLLYIGYILLDASTRGQFTWSLRILSILAFVVLFGAVSLIP